MEHALSEPGTDAPIDPEQTSVEVSQQVIGRSPWELFWRRFRRDKVAMGGALIVIVMFLIAILAPVLASFTHGPNEVHLETLDSFGIPTGPRPATPSAWTPLGETCWSVWPTAPGRRCSSRSSRPGSHR